MIISNRIIPPITHTIGFEYHIRSVVVAVVLVVAELLEVESCAALASTISILQAGKKKFVSVELKSVFHN
jgi:hypothetical protein